MNRRQYLAVVSTAVTTAGCLGGFGSGETKLGRVCIDNHDDESHTVEMKVVWDEDTVRANRYTLSADEQGDHRLPSVCPDQIWPDRAGQFRLQARLTGGEWQEIDPADDDYPDCYGVLIKVDSDGRLAIFTSTNPRECADERVPQEDTESGQSDSAQFPNQ